MAQEIIKIGTALKWRGVYSPAKTYYRDNVVACRGSVYKCERDGTVGLAPCVRANGGGYEHANPACWTVMYDGLAAEKSVLEEGARREEADAAIERRLAQEALAREAADAELLRVIGAEVYDVPIPVACVDRGPWREGAEYYHEEMNPSINRYALETSFVWHYGCKWMCLLSLTPDEPRWDSPGWAMVEGNPNLRAYFEEPDQLYDLAAFRAPLTLRLELHNRDVTDAISDSDVEWDRYSEDAGGVRRADSDAIWKAQFAASGRSGKRVELAIADLGIDAGVLPSKCVFTATATFPDGAKAVAELSVGN